jgi:DNA polymerase III alpha subunit (gram-positive type)
MHYVYQTDLYIRRSQAAAGERIREEMNKSKNKNENKSKNGTKSARTTMRTRGRSKKKKKEEEKEEQKQEQEEEEEEGRRARTRTRTRVQQIPRTRTRARATGKKQEGGEPEEEILCRNVSQCVASRESCWLQGLLFQRQVGLGGAGTSMFALTVTLSRSPRQPFISLY